MRAALPAFAVLSALLAMKAARASEGASAPNTQPRPGSCLYVQPGVKVCSALADGQGAFDVYTFMPAVLYVRTEEPIVRFVQPDPRYFQADQRENTVVIIPTRVELPERTPAIISTKSLTITLNVRRGTSRSVDTQLTLLDPLRDRRQADRDRALREAEPQIAERVRSSELSAIVDGGAEIHPIRGRTIDRNAELIVLRAKEVVHLGTIRFLVFTLENRSADAFQVKAVRLLVGDRESPAPWKMSRSVLSPADEARGALEISASVPRVAKLKLRVEELDARRTVELAGMEIR